MRRKELEDTKCSSKLTGKKKMHSDERIINADTKRRTESCRSDGRKKRGARRTMDTIVRRWTGDMPVRERDVTR